MKQKGKIFPNLVQKHLLKAALLNEVEAIVAWQKIEPKLNLNDLDIASFRLLPLVYANLNNYRFDYSLKVELKSIHRSSWYNNNLLFHKVSKVIEILRKNNIDLIIIKGAAVAKLFYSDIGQRPVNDFDFLIKQQNVFKAIDLLVELNWLGRPIAPNRFTKDNLGTLNGWNFTDSEGSGIDLHWHLLPEFLKVNSDYHYWKNAVPLKINGTPTNVLSATDLLFHSCILATKGNKHIPPLRYLADVHLILKSKHIIDWEKLIYNAVQLHMVSPIKDTLIYMNKTFNSEIPPEYIEKLDDINISEIDRLGHKARSRPRDFLGFIPSYWSLYKYQTLPSANYNIKGFLNFMKMYWGLKKNIDIPITIVKRGIQQFSKNRLSLKNR